MTNPRDARPADRNESGRNARVPLGVKQASLTASERPGYSRRWINDTGARLQQAEAGGYTFVSSDPTAKSTDVGARTSRVVGRNENGQGMRAYLMEIPMEWYQEDQKVKLKPVEAFEQALQGKPAIEGGYIPRSGGTRIERG